MALSGVGPGDAVGAMTLWTPQAQDEHSKEEVHVDARPAFGHAVRCVVTRAELFGLVRRLRAESAAKRIDVSNDMFRKCVSFDVDTHTQCEFEEYCGRVIVFYCCRLILDERGVPLLDPCPTEEADHT